MSLISQTDPVGNAISFRRFPRKHIMLMAPVCLQLGFGTSCCTHRRKVQDFAASPVRFRRQCQSFELTTHSAPTLFLAILVLPVPDRFGHVSLSLSVLQVYFTYAIIRPLLPSMPLSVTRNTEGNEILHYIATKLASGFQMVYL
jgi:hypothetical protein